MKIVYADVLILINFSMDFIALFLTGKFCHIKLRPLFLAISAAIGGIYSLAEFLLPAPLPFLEIILNFTVSYVMCLISFGYKKLKTLLYTAVFYGICFLFGGMISGIYSLVGSKWQLMADTGYIYSDISIADIAVLSAVSVFLYYIVSRFIQAKRSGKAADIKVTINQVERDLHCFVDSGCIAKEPITNRPVFFIKEDLLEKFDIESLDERRLADIDIHFCYVPINTITSCELMLGIFTNKLISNSKEFSAIAMFVDARKFNFSDYDAIIPQLFI